MFTVDLLGYIAGAFLLLMASMKSQTAMRLCNIAGNICFIASGVSRFIKIRKRHKMRNLGAICGST